MVLGPVKAVMGRNLRGEGIFWFFGGQAGVRKQGGAGVSCTPKMLVVVWGCVSKKQMEGGEDAYVHKSLCMCVCILRS